ncbi:hypothetical protein B0H19DRAFT_718467 [Mycena capillaripes]|nr:hypothetical protein B0H19DRAFT_718467 [Mycena capillaripes]
MPAKLGRSTALRVAPLFISFTGVQSCCTIRDVYDSSCGIAFHAVYAFYTAVSNLTALRSSDLRFGAGHRPTRTESRFPTAFPNTNAPTDSMQTLITIILILSLPSYFIFRFLQQRKHNLKGLSVPRTSVITRFVSIIFDPYRTQGSSQIVKEVLAGRQRIVSHVGASQYKGGGIASCGLAGLNFVRVVLGRVEGGLEGRPLLENVLSQRTSEEVLSVCSRWTSNVHLEVEDIFAVPLFKRVLSLVFTTYGEPSFDRFREALLDLRNIPSDYAAVLITRPPEIITCFKLPIDSLAGKQNVFIIFDPHPRPAHPDGAGFIVNTSLNETASHLENLLAVDSRLLADRSLQWETQLLAHFSGHFFVTKSGVENTMEEAVLESSLLVLSLQAQVSDLRNSSSLRDRHALEMDLEELKDKYRSVKRRLDSNLRSCAQCIQRNSSSPKSTENYHEPHPVSGPSKLPTSPPSSPPNLNTLGYYSSPAHIPRSRPNLDSLDHLVATQLQMGIGMDIDSGRSSSVQVVHSKPRDVAMDDYMIAAQLQIEWDQTQHDDDLRARAQQREFEEEDAWLIAERGALQRDVELGFECGVCFDKYPEDYVSRIAECAHAFCRDCMKGYVVSKLKAKLYPIFCPVCVTDTTRIEPGMITDDMVQMLGIDDKEYQTLQELQIASLSILLHCRKCKQSVFVDRAEYEAAPILVCPLPRCSYSWCKACQQRIVTDGSEHSCDGSSELEHLMKRQGWKHCPGCKTPFQKSSGCNHMTCMSPGCNTHFCYLCGESIVRSTLRGEIQRAVSAHYANRCRLFEDVPDR